MLFGHDDEAPGWDAIETAVAAVTELEPLHWGGAALPGQDGIYGLNDYPLSGYWLLVTLGLTELFGKQSEDWQVSGWGFELTMRVPAADAQPPTWALRLLHKLGAYVFSSGRPFEPGHRLDPGGPITGAPDCRLTAVAFAEDPQLPVIDSPHGTARLLTVVGITGDELARMKASTTGQVLAEISTASPLLITDRRR